MAALVQRINGQEAWMKDQIKQAFDSCVARDTLVDGRIDRRRREVDLLRRAVGELEGDQDLLKSQVESMSNKLCHCSARSPVLSGTGSQEDPHELEYASADEYHSPPITSPPSENSAPIPIPDRAEDTPLPASDQENVGSTCCALVGPIRPPLIPIDKPVGMMEEEIAWRSIGGPHRICHTKRKNIFATLPFPRVKAYSTQIGRKSTCLRQQYDCPSVADMRRRGRRLQRGTESGYTSDSKSGSSGILDCERGDGNRHSSS